MDICKVLYEREYSSWRELELEIEKIPITVEKGNAFEQVCFYYLMYNKDLYQIDYVYTNKIPGHEIPPTIISTLHMNPNIDDGVDGVYSSMGGRLTAYQAKFRSMRRSPSSNELNNFWSEGEYADQRLVIANSMSLPQDVNRRNNAIFILGHMFDQLPREFFTFLYENAKASHEKRVSPSARKEKFSPRPYQKEIIDSCVAGFKENDRGKVIAACAAGKTLISLWVSEELKSKSVIFFAPNLALVRQSISNWTAHCNDPFVYLAVCSDQTVSGDTDEFTINSDELDIAVTTNADDIRKFLTYDTSTKKVIFSTYQSVDCIIESINGLENYQFDFAIYDEAHRTAGASTSGLFQKALLDYFIPVSKRLFMTATERLATPRLKQRFEQQNRVLFSMDDEEKYGPVFYRLPFGKAIEEGIIADYKIIVAAMTSAELFRIVRGNAYVTISHNEEEILTDVEAQNVFKGAMFSKVMLTTGATKAVSFHSSIPAARRFVNLVSKLPELPSDRYVAHVNGSFSAAERSAVFKTFEDSSFGLITNVRCLTEGVDIPYIDAIMFADPRNSLIDIVQAVGRALRKPFGISEKTSYIIVPILLDENNGGMDDDEAFATMHSIIQALRDQDEMLADWIDKINFAVVRGSGGGGGGFTDDDPVSVILSSDIDYEKFCNNLALRISVANGRPTGMTGLGSTLGRNERGSSIVRVFKTVADYNYKALKDSLVDPTLGKFSDPNGKMERKQILINNNNVSHTQRLGLIKKNSDGLFELTPIGKQYQSGEIEFTELFVNQMLHYQIESNGHVLYPYRAALKVLKMVNTLNYLEFLYGLYSMDISVPEDDAVAETVDRIMLLRETYPNIMKASMGNQETLRLALNETMGIEYSERDVWTDRTTTGNQYRFFLNHISLLTDCFVINLRKKQIEVSNVSAIDLVLNGSEDTMKRPEYNYTERM